MIKRINVFEKIVKLAAIITVSILGFLLIYIFVNGLPNLKISLFSLNYTTENVSSLPAIITTIMLVFISLLIASPLGIFTSIYLVEYANKNSLFIDLIRLAIETLGGIPSIVYGLFGMLFFVTRLRLGYSVISGALTISIMILPLIIRTTEESLLAVNEEIKYASYALGAGKIRTIFKVILPAALPGIISGIILSTGRIVGETAALIYTLGTVPKIPTSILDSGRTLAVHMYALSSEAFYIKEANATAVILVFIVIFINYLSEYIFNKIKGD